MKVKLSWSSHSDHARALCNCLFIDCLSSFRAIFWMFFYHFCVTIIVVCDKLEDDFVYSPNEEEKFSRLK